MRRFLIALACLATAACDQMPDLQNIAGGAGGGSSDMVRPRDLEGFLRDGMVWCYDYDASNQTCTFIERIRQVSASGFVLDQYFLLALNEGRDVLKVQSVQNLSFRHDGSARACSSRAATLTTMRFYQMRTAEASIGDGEQALPDDINAQLVNLLRQEGERGGGADETCWGWRVVSREPQWDIVQIEYVDAIAQPDESPSTVRLFPIGSNFLRLRPAS